MATATRERTMTTGEIGRLTGAPGWTIRRILDAGTVANVTRAGLYRLVSDDDLPKVLAALEAAGYPAKDKDGA